MKKIIAALTLAAISFNANAHDCDTVKLATSILQQQAIEDKVDASIAIQFNNIKIVSCTPNRLDAIQRFTRQTVVNDILDTQFKGLRLKPIPTDQTEQDVYYAALAQTNDAYKLARTATEYQIAKIKYLDRRNP